ncbi:MAG: hypothetical protein HLUCCA08_15115 [Rhodobacteraceae bacterium HLUCCA08]|nr:MAG: hypothetical protein HLUCCA08_15115 [Rhodobacteraceae bacterium HLUCCA08]
MKQLVFGALCILAFAPQAGAGNLTDVYCDDSARLDRTLETTHRAERIGSGLRSPDALVEIWIAPASGDWILVQRYASGTACIVALGEDWESAPAGADPA